MNLKIVNIRENKVEAGSMKVSLKTVPGFTSKVGSA